MPRPHACLGCLFFHVCFAAGQRTREPLPVLPAGRGGQARGSARPTRVRKRRPRPLTRQTTLRKSLTTKGSGPSEAASQPLAWALKVALGARTQPRAGAPVHPGAGCPVPSTREGGPETPRSAQRALLAPTPHPLRWGSEPAAPWQHNTPLTKFRHGRRGRSGVDWACVCGATGAQNVGPSACQRVCAAAQASQWNPSSTDATLNT